MKRTAFFQHRLPKPRHHSKKTIVSTGVIRIPNRRTDATLQPAAQNNKKVYLAQPAYFSAPFTSDDRQRSRVLSFSTQHAMSFSHLEHR